MKFSELPKLIGNEIVEEILRNKYGRLIEIGHDDNVVLWYDKSKNEYIVHNIVLVANGDTWCFENGSYFDNSIDAMRCFIEKCQTIKFNHIDALFSSHTKEPKLIQMQWLSLPKKLQDILINIGADLIPTDPAYGVNAHVYAVYQIEKPATSEDYYDEEDFDSETLELLRKLYNSIKNYDYLILRP